MKTKKGEDVIIIALDPEEIISGGEKVGVDITAEEAVEILGTLFKNEEMEEDLEQSVNKEIGGVTTAYKALAWNDKSEKFKKTRTRKGLKGSADYKKYTYCLSIASDIEEKVKVATSQL